MSKKTPLYEGKAKQLFEGPEPGTLIQHFKDDATAFNNQKKGTIAGKGIVNNRITEYLMTRLMEIGIPTHFIRNINMREQLVYAVEIIPLEVIVRNYAAGSFATRFGAIEGEAIGAPLVEYCLKDDRLGDPFLSEELIFAFDVCDPSELEEIRYYAIRISDFLSGIFRGVGIQLVDMKFEFGRLYNGDQVQIVLADEISPDTCRLWDVKTGEKLDKDRFRKNLGGESDAYREVARRLGVLPGADIVDAKISGSKKAAKPAKAEKVTTLKDRTAERVKHAGPKLASNKKSPKGGKKKK